MSVHVLLLAGPGSVPNSESAAGLCNAHQSQIQRFNKLLPKYLKLVAERFLKDGSELTGERKVVPLFLMCACMQEWQYKYLLT